MDGGTAKESLIVTIAGTTFANTITAVSQCVSAGVKDHHQTKNQNANKQLWGNLSMTSLLGPTKWL
jgi:hypothetical protein